MKTRKQKDQKQRLNYAKHEVQHVLASYYNKKTNDKTVNLVYRLPQTKDINSTPYGCESQRNCPTSRNEALPKGKMIPTGSFTYPNTLKKVFNEHTQIKSLLLLESYRQTRSTTGSTTTFNRQGGSSCSTGLLYDYDLLKAAYGSRQHRRNTITRIRGRCTQSNRPRSVSRLFRLSRIRSRTLILNGKISGCSRAT